MSLVVANAQELEVLAWYLQTEDLFLRLYTNNVTPNETSTAASFNNVVAGGSGYVPKTLDKTLWLLTAGDPSYGEYPEQVFGFAGAIDIPGTIYGYYVVNAAGTLRWAERFPGANVPFSPINGSTIKFTPRFACS